MYEAEGAIQYACGNIVQDIIDANSVPTVNLNLLKYLDMEGIGGIHCCSDIINKANKA